MQIQDVSKVDVSKISKKVTGSMKTAKMKDSMTVGLIAGVIGTLAMDVLNVLLWRKGKTELLYGHMAGSMVMMASRTNRTRNFILGQLFHMITGAGLGVIHMELLKRYGKDNHLLKGGVIGLFTWGILYNFGQKVNLYSHRAHLTRTHYSELFSNILYGLTTAQIIASLSDPSIFKNKKSKQKGDNASAIASFQYPTYGSTSTNRVKEYSH